MTESTFRGIKGIRDIKARMVGLAKWYRQFKPGVTDIILERKDYDLIARWPKAADVDGIFFDGFRLTFDTGQGRYNKNQGPQQTVIA
jgi:hypothetical protein